MINKKSRNFSLLILCIIEKQTYIQIYAFIHLINKFILIP